MSRFQTAAHYERPPLRHVPASTVQDSVTVIPLPDQSFAGSVYDAGYPQAAPYPRAGAATPYARSEQSIRGEIPDAGRYTPYQPPQSNYAPYTAPESEYEAPTLGLRSHSYETPRSETYNDERPSTVRSHSTQGTSFSRSAVFVPRPGSPVTVGGVRVRVQENTGSSSRGGSVSSGSHYSSSSRRGRSQDDLRHYQDHRPESRTSRRSHEEHYRSESRASSQRSYTSHRSCDCSACRRYGHHEARVRANCAK